MELYNKERYDKENMQEQRITRSKKHKQTNYLIVITSIFLIDEQSK